MTAPIIVLDETVSTNTEAMTRALRGAATPFWIVAHRQTGGRGRSGRAWVSAPGNLYASLAIALDAEPHRLGEVSLVAGVATAEYLRSCAATAGLDPGLVVLKWPNDILAGPGRDKAGGILVESTLDTGADPKRRLVVIGLGLNLVSTPELGGQTSTSLAKLGLTLETLAAVNGISVLLCKLLADWTRTSDATAVLTRWKACATPSGEVMTVHSGEAKVRGRFVGLDRDGALLLEDPETGGVSRHTFGDVTLEAP